MLKSTVLYAEHAIRTAPPGTADAFTGGKIEGGGSEVTQKISQVVKVTNIEL